MVRNTISAALAAVLGTAMLAAPGMAQQAPVVVGGVPVAGAASEDALLWALAEQQGTAAAYRSYLSGFPNGAHAAEARARLGQILAGGVPVVTTPGATVPVVTTPGATAPVVVPPVAESPAGRSPADAAQDEVLGAQPGVPTTTPGAGSGASAAATEAALGLDRDARRAVQSALTRLGYDTNGVDGVFGSGTRRAIRAWQAAQGVPATGYLDDAQARQLRAAGRPGGAETAAATGAAAEAALGLGPAQRRAIQSRLTQLGYGTNGVDGTFGSGTRRAIRAWQAATGAAATGYLTAAQADTLAGGAGQGAGTGGAVGADGAARAELALNLTREDRIAAQRGLTRAGHDTRGVDGVFGSGTRRAIRAWQAAQGQAATGYLTAGQLASLRGSTPVVVPAGGAGAADEARLNLGATERTEVQSRLAALGYDPRGIDGRFGPGSRRAISAWQGDNGLAATGYLDADQLARLRSQRRN